MTQSTRQPYEMCNQPITPEEYQERTEEIRHGARSISVLGGVVATAGASVAVAHLALTHEQNYNPGLLAGILYSQEFGVGACGIAGMAWFVAWRRDRRQLDQQRGYDSATIAAIATASEPWDVYEAQLLSFYDSPDDN